MKFLSILLFVLPILSYAELSIDFTDNLDNRDYFLSSDNCNELQLELNDILYLTSDYEKTPLKNITIDCSTSTNKLLLNRLVPKKIEDLLNTKPEYYGPNCWNSVLIANKLSPAVRYSSPEEYDKALRFYNCINKPLEQKLMPGDIIRLLDGRSDELHSFIFISPNISFTKNGPSTMARYEIARTQDIFMYYNIDSTCFYKTDRKINPLCANRIQVYDCQNIPEINENTNLKQSLLEVEAQTSFLVLNYHQFKTKESRQSYIYELTQRTSNLYFVLYGDLLYGKLNKEDFMQEDYMLSRVNSIRDQLSYF
jgi:hypothetical protein